MKRILNEKIEKLKKIDYLIIGIIVIIYSIISFINLGDIKSPQTYYEMIENEMITIELKKEEDIVKIKYYEMENSTDFQIYCLTENEEISDRIISNSNSSFAWTETKILKKAKYIKLAATSNSSLAEIAIYGNNNQIIPINKVTSNDKKIYELTDEQNYIPKDINYQNSTYYNETISARSAYEYLNNLQVLEWYNPPLGKVIQALPIKISNTMAPFYYRFISNISGILMIPIMYIIGKELFKKRKYAIFSSLLISLDNFHFVETRIGTTNSILVLFVLLSFYFIFKYINNKNKTLILIMTGLFIGLAISIDWSAIFGLLSILIILIIDIIKTKKLDIKLILKLALFLIIIPIIIYILCFTLSPKIINQNNEVYNIFDQNKEILKYQSINKDNRLSSKWYQLPIFYKPVWYYTKQVDTMHTQTIVSIGNIAIYWFSIIAIIYLIVIVLKKKEQNSIYLLLIYLILYIPNILVNKITYQYDYLLLMPFIILIIVNLFKHIEEKYKTNYAIPIYLAIVAFVFILYFPIVSGYTISNEYTENLKLLNTWIW